MTAASQDNHRKKIELLQHYMTAASQDNHRKQIELLWAQHDCSKSTRASSCTSFTEIKFKKPPRKIHNQ